MTNNFDRERRKQEKIRKKAIRQLNLHLPKEKKVSKKAAEEWWGDQYADLWVRNWKTCENHDEADRLTDQDMVRWRDDLNKRFADFCKENYHYQEGY